jgi:hypothetical protein
MRGSLSPETKIDNALRELDCSGRPFVDIARSSGVAVSHGTYSEVMNGKKDFPQETADKLLDILGQMLRLQRAISDDVPIDWSRTERVATALALRRHQQALLEDGDHSLDEFAEKATKSVVS